MDPGSGGVLDFPASASFGSGSGVMSDLLPSQYEFRAGLVERLTRDLLGPHEEHEIIDDAPIEEYIVGVLYPQSSDALSPEHDFDEADEDEEAGNLDPPVSLANRRYPSSVGLTFAVDTRATQTVTIEVAAARYEEIANELADSVTPLGLATAPYERDESQGAGRSWRWTGGDERATRWKRIPLHFDPIEVDVTNPGNLRLGIGEGLELFCRVRRPDERGAASVTAALINKLVVRSGMRDASSFFQPRLKVVGHPDAPGPFVERPSGTPPAGDEDLRSYDLIYRHACNFGVGHGCAVEWIADERDASRAVSVETAFVPRYELRLSDSNRRIDESSLGMRFFAEGTRGSVTTALAGLNDGYSDWIDTTDARSRSEFANEPELAETAGRHIWAARQAVDRMRRGVELLRTDARAWEAFRLANAAMAQQRARADWIRAGTPAPGPTKDDVHRWRPFQIAFILLCLEDIVNPATSETRDEVDLLWFPTGGGKTEAYLGLIAFTVFHRRLREPAAGGGVTALMRYTLRLLTIQQFERAALLLTACEAIRRQRPDLGSEPISIGLWVGQSATPNTLRYAQEALKTLQAGGVLESGNPIQLRRCPWCGRELDYSNYYLRKDRSRMVIACRNLDCQFREGLPVFVIDEDIYRHRPTLLIATVDKFARLPWDDQTSALFNLDHPDPPPELIVQDELHLISGPLGTLTGLYETAVDALATHEGVRPKIVASTATIRRAGEQTRGLFARQVNQFPPTGIDARDSYFAVEVPPDERGARLYVGVCAPGTSQTTLLIRTYAALLQGTGELPGSDRVKDPYWTLVGYFNSLRVLGAANIQARDDVTDRIELLAARAGLDARKTDEQIELTSRRPSSEIPGHLEHMGVQLPDNRAIDIILATNMISVGIDIDRLGLMVVAGQPQSTSEYIQSTSRVGRRHPGLVVTMLNAAKSRDRSHYESFVGFHSALYRQVEATSVTPFSPRARDRGLHAVLVTLARLTNTKLQPNQSASEVSAHRPALESLVELIVSRARDIDESEAPHTEAHLRKIIDDWESKAEEGSALFFNNPRVPGSSLLRAADDSNADDGFPTLWSLRDVDAESHLYLVDA